MSTDYRKIVSSGILLSTSLFLISCGSDNDGNVEIVETSTPVTTSSTATKDKITEENIKQVNPNKDSVNEIYEVANDFVYYLGSPIDENVINDDNINLPEQSPEALAFHESHIDISPYYDYDNLDFETKSQINRQVFEMKAMSTMLGTYQLYDYTIDDDFITIEGDTAIINGKGIKARINSEEFVASIEEAEDFANDDVYINPNFNLALKQNDNGWKIVNDDYTDFHIDGNK